MGVNQPHGINSCKDMIMDTQNFHVPTGRSVWMGRDLAKSTDWVFELPQNARDEIDACLVRLKASGKPTEAIGPADMQLASLDNAIKSIREEVATGRGFVVVRGLEAAKYTLDELRKIYWGIGSHFGQAMPQSYLGDRIGTIMDVSDEEPDRTKRRGYHSGGAQFVHTDSCDIVSMLSIQVAKQGGEARLASAHTVHNLMLEHCPGLLQVFYDGFFLRGTDNDAAASGRPAFYGYRVPAYAYTDGWLNCSYVRGYVDRAVEAGDVTLSPVEQAAVEVFAAFSNHPEVCLDTLLLPGDMQFVNNRTMLHGRAHFEDHPEKERRRHLLRLWLSVEEWPRMAKLQTMHSDASKLKWAEAAAARSVTAH